MHAAQRRQSRKAPQQESLHPQPSHTFSNVSVHRKSDGHTASPVVAVSTANNNNMANNPNDESSPSILLTDSLRDEVKSGGGSFALSGSVALEVAATLSALGARTRSNLAKEKMEREERDLKDRLAVALATVQQQVNRLEHYDKGISMSQTTLLAQGRRREAELGALGRQLRSAEEEVDGLRKKVAALRSGIAGHRDRYVSLTKALRAQKAAMAANFIPKQEQHKFQVSPRPSQSERSGSLSTNASPKLPPPVAVASVEVDPEELFSPEILRGDYDTLARNVRSAHLQREAAKARERAELEQRKKKFEEEEERWAPFDEDVKLARRELLEKERREQEESRRREAEIALKAQRRRKYEKAAEAAMKKICQPPT